MQTLPSVESLISELAARGIVLPHGPVRVDGYGVQPNCQVNFSTSSSQGVSVLGPDYFGPMNTNVNLSPSVETSKSLLTISTSLH